MIGSPSRNRTRRRVAGDLSRIAPRRRDPWEWVLLIGFWGAVGSVPAFFLISALIPQWTVDVTVTLPAPPAVVFSRLEEPAARLAWEPGLVAITPMRGDGRQAGDTRMLFLAGTRGRWHETETVVVRQPPKRIVWQRDGPVAGRRITISLTRRSASADSGRAATALHWREEIRYRSWRSRLFAWFASRERRKQLVNGLTRLCAQGRDQAC